MAQGRLPDDGNNGLFRETSLDALQCFTIDLLDELLKGHEKVALIDVPRHPNFGDSLIWWGEETYLRKLGKRVIYRCSVYDYEVGVARKSFPPNTAILFQGGGNLGDLYPHHDNLRRRVIRDFPDLTKIVLSQSLYAQDLEWATTARSDYAAEHHLTILLRDQASLDRAQYLLPESDIRSCPDLALGAPVPMTRSHQRRALLLSRDDEEKASPVTHPGTSMEVSDWQGSRWWRLRWKVLIRALGFLSSQKLMPTAIKVPLQNRGLHYLARSCCRQAIAQLQGRRAVATDRLHAHILCSLMGIEHYVTDNSYGKISEVYRYTKGIGGAHWCSTLEEAVTRAVSAESPSHGSSPESDF